MNTTVVLDALPMKRNRHGASHLAWCRCGSRSRSSTHHHACTTPKTRKIRNFGDVRKNNILDSKFLKLISSCQMHLFISKLSPAQVMVTKVRSLALLLPRKFDYLSLLEAINGDIQKETTVMIMIVQDVSNTHLLPSQRPGHTHTDIRHGQSSLSTN